MLRLLSCLLLIFSGKLLPAQCTGLVCLNQVDISLDQNGQAVITPADILSTTSNCPGPKTVTVRTQAGILVPDATVDCSFVGQNVEVTVTDEATGISCWGFALIEDKLPPLLTCNDLTVNCTQDTDPAVLGFPQAVDNCGGPVDLSFFDTVVDDQCDGDNIARVITRTVFAAGQGGTSSCTQTITVTAATLSDVVFPADLSGVNALDCAMADTSAAVTGLPSVFGAPVSLSCKLNLLYSDVAFSDCPGNLSIVRTFTVIDCCTGETLTDTQIIEVRDNTPPSFVCPDTIRIGIGSSQVCTGAFLLPPLVATDDCSGPVSVQVSGPGGALPGNGGLVTDLPLGNSLISYTVSDACGNTATCAVPVIVTDNQAPVMICDELTSVNINSTGLSTVPAFVFDDGGYDACCGPIDSFEVRRMSEPVTSFAPAVVFDCDDVGDTVMVVVRGFDCFGNFNECMVEVEVEDKILPSLTCPADITLDCSVEAFSPADLGLFAVANDNCTLGTTTFSDDTTVQNMCGPLVIERTFFLIGPGTFRDSCVQTITFADNEPPVYTFPADTTINCSELEGDFADGLNTGFPTAMDNCGEPFFFLNVKDTTFTFGCELKIVRTFSYLDMCTGFDTTAQQTIKLIDDAPPVFDQAPGSLDVLVQCVEDTLGLVLSVPTATDICDNGVNIRLAAETRSVLKDACSEFTRRLSYVAEDDCGNVSDTFFVSLLVRDTIAPVVGACVAQYNFIANLSCFTIAQVFAPGATDNCGEALTITNSYNDQLGNLLDTFFIGDTTVTFFVTDACGNVDSCLSNITVRDISPPTITCGAAEVRLDQTGNGNIVLADVIGTGPDCSEPLLFASDLASTAVDCASPPSIAFEVTVTDAVGNTASCAQQILVCQPLSNTPPILPVCEVKPGQTPLPICSGAQIVGGSIRTPAGEPLAGVPVAQTDATLSLDTVTNAYGNYFFRNTAVATLPCTLLPTKTDDLLRDVSTYDIVLLSRHILGTAPLAGPYLRIAADVNNSGSISTLDIVALRRAILFIDTTFPNNHAYRFVPRDYTFPDPANPWAENFPEAHTLTAMEGEMLGFNFVAVKIGDLDAPQHPWQNATDTDTEQRRAATLQTPDQIFAANETLRLPLYADGAKAIYGLQAAWEIDETLLQYEGIEAGSLTGLTDAHAHSQDGTLRLSYADAQLKALSDAPLAYLRLRTLQAGTLATSMQASEALPGMLYPTDQAEQPLSWTITGAATLPDGVPQAALPILYPNRPNPFRTTTRITFTLPEAGTATLRVYDTAGRVLWTDTRVRDAGRHEVAVSLPEVRGLLFYQLTTAGGTQTRRMVAE